VNALNNADSPAKVRVVRVGVFDADDEAVHVPVGVLQVVRVAARGLRGEVGAGRGRRVHVALAEGGGRVVGGVVAAGRGHLVAVEVVVVDGRGVGVGRVRDVVERGARRERTRVALRRLSLETVN